MRIRLTSIGLSCSGKRFGIGEEVGVGDDDGCIPHAVAVARLKAGTAEVVGADAGSPIYSVQSAEDAFQMILAVEAWFDAHPEERDALATRAREHFAQTHPEAGAGEADVSAPADPQPASETGDAPSPDGAAADNAASNDTPPAGAPEPADGADAAGAQASAAEAGVTSIAQSAGEGAQASSTDGGVTNVAETASPPAAEAAPAHPPKASRRRPAQG